MKILLDWRTKQAEPPRVKFLQKLHLIAPNKHSVVRPAQQWPPTEQLYGEKVRQCQMTLQKYSILHLYFVRSICNCVCVNTNTNTDFEEEVGLGDLVSKKHGKGTKLAAKALLVS